MTDLQLLPEPDAPLWPVELRVALGALLTLPAALAWITLALGGAP